MIRIAIQNAVSNLEEKEPLHEIGLIRHFRVYGTRIQLSADIIRRAAERIWIAENPQHIRDI
jgi:hypothetical protein